ncbi:glycosyltransferase [Hahella ganghwensis]|uniref:glycosyltransferase n=1 Tax=Hahella ganghwensis TaxID=286420 RepID=UPI00037A592B|nr:glycosyltransferase [Hahella ganghwensis]
MRPIKVLHVTYDMRIGGTEQVIKSLIENTDATKVDMSIFCIESPLGPFADDLLKEGVQITALSRQPGFDVNLIKGIRQHIQDHDIDIVHCHQYTPYVYGVIAALFSRARVIFTEHGRFYPDRSSWKRKLVNPWLHRITAATTAISAATRTALAVYENIPESDIQVIYNGIKALQADETQVKALREELAIPKDALCLGTVARLDPIKNHPMMLKAFKRVLGAGISARLIIVGDGDERKTITDLIKELQLESHVILTGYDPKPQRYLALMDVYLLSSLSEGTSMTLLETMSLGKACVVTDAGGNPEIVEHGVTGLVTPNDDAEAFANGIIEICCAEETRLEMGVKARKRFDQLFSVESMVSAFQQLYSKALGTK